LQIGYFAQHQLEQLRPDESALWHLTRRRRRRAQELRDFIGGFNFHGDQATNRWDRCPAERNPAWRWH